RVVLPAALLVLSGLLASPQQEAPRDPVPQLGRELDALRRRSAPGEPGTPAARKLASELGRIGAGYLEAGDNGRAIELLEEAYGWDEQNGLVLSELTLAYVRAEDFAFARFYLELAEQ